MPRMAKKIFTTPNKTTSCQELGAASCTVRQVGYLGQTDPVWGPRMLARRRHMPPPHPSPNGGDSCMLLVGMHNGNYALENSLVVSCKLILITEAALPLLFTQEQ